MHCDLTQIQVIKQNMTDKFSEVEARTANMGFGYTAGGRNQCFGL